MNDFWIKLNKQCQKEKRPILALAPMAGVTDSAFRQICKEFGADVVYSEMASVNALAYSPKKTLEMLVASQKESPYVVQLFGSKPEHFAKAVKILTDKKLISKMLIPQPPLLARHGFSEGGRKGAFCEGFDINFGCPVKKVLKQGAGAVMMDNPALASEIIKSVTENTDLPVSIKIRSKGRTTDALTFLSKINSGKVKAIMIHGRTTANGFSGSIDTEIIKKSREYFSGIILANGGIMKPEDAAELLRETGVDGVGIARGAMGRPWIFRATRIAYRTSRNAQRVSQSEFDEKNIRQVVKIILKHAKLIEKLKGERGIIEMRGLLCAYINGFAGARELRKEFVKVKSFNEIKDLLK